MNSYRQADSFATFPSTIITRNGVTVEPWRATWSYRDTLIDVHLDFSALPITESLRNSFQNVFIWYAENKSPYYLNNTFKYISRLFKFYSSLINCDKIDAVTINMLTSYRASLSQNNDYYIGSMVHFFKRLHSQGFDGIDNEAIYYLENTSFKRNIEGAALLTMDPARGPFSDIEFQAININLQNVRKRELISLQDFLLIWLFLALGQRPVQYAALKICDFQTSKSKSGEIIYSLQIPRAKQRGEVTRTSFKSRIIYEEIGTLFLLHIQNLKIKCNESQTDLNNFPLFPAKHRSPDAPKGYEWHQTAVSLIKETRQIADTFKITSERTGYPLRISPRRFRYTVGTRAAIEGHGELIIAEMLDHSDTQTATIYVKAVPELIERFTEKLAFQLAPLANAFKGRIIDPEAESSKPENTFLRIFAPERTGNMRPTGSCGEHSLCGLMEPLACYTCQSFQPWLDAPHATILECLIEERERIQTATADGNARIASINDLTILAVAEVVSQCEKIRATKTIANKTTITI